MKSVFSLVAVLVLSAAMVGCNKFASGTAIIKHDKGTTPIVATAPHSGNYAVYGTFDTTAKWNATLQQGDALGFKTGETGQVIAVAGDKEQVLPDGSYIWKQRD